MTKRRYAPRFRHTNGVVCALLETWPHNRDPWGKRSYRAFCGNHEDFRKGTHPETSDPLTCLECIAEGANDVGAKPPLRAFYRKPRPAGGEAD